MIKEIHLLEVKKIRRNVMAKVPIQKGKIEVKQKNYQTETYSQKEACRVREMKMLRSAQTLTLHIPKQ
jgi:hypothetical protein